MDYESTRLAWPLRFLGLSPQRPIARGINGWIIDILLLGARLFASVWMVGAGLDKLPTPDWMVDQVSQVGFPAPYFFAVCAEMSEYAGGVLLAIGLFSRPAALALAFTMGIAAFGFHRVNPILDYHITQGFFWLYIAFLAVGPGRFSLDHILSRISTNRNEDTITIKPKPYLLIGALIATPVVGYGLFRDFTMEWTAPPEQSNISMEGVNSLSIAGTFNEWDTSATPLTPNDDNSVWSTELTLPAGVTELKFVANESWDMNMGDADQTASAVPFDGAGDLDADNIRAFITEPGIYRVSLNTSDFTYSIEQAIGSPNPSTDALIGTWRIDLRPTLESPPNYIEMVIDSIEDGVPSGTFYSGSEITNARVTNTFGVVRFAFVTSDGSGLYHTSGELVNGNITGMTHAIERDFVMPWRGEKTD
jgi:putative oxidoreductase